ncbi:MFS transporter [Pseudonocardia sp. HH130630-07]|uniref:MFS transporter n=1 Tax=Pseudonocardia sp. HH130630-07 TaxID=1690815 RepID=UPI0008151127|nr:MFS transporter [Pseudonocardia sp. HH130630-07]ANY07734.1 hypothetical protein AFB00_17155 [Pseudonocardia sp. HH130630-07]
MTAEQVESTRQDGSRPGWVLASVVIASALMGIDMIIVAVALPQIGVELPGTSLVSLQWLVVGYSLAFAALVQPAGALSDRWGSRSLFLAGIAGFTLASLACGLSWDMLSLNIFRIVQGAAAAVMSANVVPLLVRAIEEKRRPMAIAIWTATVTSASTLAPLVGGALIAAGGWRWMFFVNVPFGVIAFLVAYRVVSADRPGTAVAGRFDVVGAALVAAVFVALNLGLSLAQENGFATVGAVVGLVAAVLLAAAYSVRCRRIPTPVLDLGLFRIRAFAGITVLAMVNRIGTVGGAVFYIVYLQVGHGLSALTTGVVLVPLGVATALGALAGGRLQARVPARWVLAAGFGMLAVAGVLIAVNAAAAADPVTAIPALSLWGFGNGLANAPLQAVAAAAVPPEKVGMATGMVNSFFPVGASLGTSVLGLVFTGAVGQVDAMTVGRPELLGQGIATVFGLVAAAMAVGAVVSGALIGARRAAPA